MSDNKPGPRCAVKFCRNIAREHRTLPVAGRWVSAFICPSCAGRGYTRVFLKARRPGSS